ncbi:hypothetical protein D3C77_723210 [compost metagenome]
MRWAMLPVSRYLTRMFDGALARKACASASLRRTGRSSTSAAKMKRVEGRPKRRFSENITR